MGWFRKKTILFLIAALFLVYGILCPAAVFAQDAYKIISTQQDFEAVLGEARTLLATHFAIALRLPVSGFLVPAKELDSLYSGAYRGAETGLYRSKAGRHEVYIMQDMSKDECIATTCHELVHAWQTECCPSDQDQVVKEGFARWVEYKILDKIGAYAIARNLAEHADPVYGVGFKKMLEWEDQLGEIGVLLKVKQIKTLDE